MGYIADYTIVLDGWVGACLAPQARPVHDAAEAGGGGGGSGGEAAAALPAIGGAASGADRHLD